MNEIILDALNSVEVRNRVLFSMYAPHISNREEFEDLWTEIFKSGGLVPPHHPIVDDWNMASSIRDLYIRVYGFVRLSEEFVNALAEYLKGKKVLSIMSGSCTLERHLFDRGIDIICTDNNEWVDKPNGDLPSKYSAWNSDFAKEHLEKLEACEAIRKYGRDVDYVLCAWPPYTSPAATNAIRTMNEVRFGLPMIYIGEGDGGCCADDEFFALTTQIEDEAFDKVIDSYKPFRFIYDNPKLLRLDFN